jgi:uncharacterized repeat protein (TIGR03943 family)
VNRAAQGLIVSVMGAVVVLTAAAGWYRSYVRSWMGVPLLVCGIGLVVLGLWTARRTPSDEHLHVPRVAWLLLVPVAVLVVVQPPSLGSHAVSQRNAQPDIKPIRFGALSEPVDGVVELGVRDFRERALYDEDQSLDDVRVRLIGFVVGEDGVSDSFLLTRFAIYCCAADAIANQVEVRGLDGPVPADDTWVEVVGMWETDTGGYVDHKYVPPVLVADSVHEIGEPANPYE